MNAYQVQDFQVVSKSNLERDRFDVVAKVPSGATSDQFRAMLQNFLAERFHLKLHHEARELPGWELVVAKSGLKIKESQVGPVSDDTSRGSIGKDGFPILPEGSGNRGVLFHRRRLCHRTYYRAAAADLSACE